MNVQGEVISLRGTLSEPYGATSFDGLLRGNELNGTLDSAAFDAVPFSAIAETPPNPYSGWVKLQLKGPGSVDEVVPGFWVVAENQPYVNLDAAYIADPNDQNISDAYGRAIYTGGGSWFATMTWSNNVSGYLFRVLLLPGSTEAQVEVIQNNQIVIGGQGSYTLISYTP